MVLRAYFTQFFIGIAMNTKQEETGWNYRLCGNYDTKPNSHKYPLGIISKSNSWNKVPSCY